MCNKWLQVQLPNPALPIVIDTRQTVKKESTDTCKLT